MNCYFFFFFFDIVLNSFNTNDFNCICLRTLFFYRISCKYHIYQTTSAPHLGIKKFISKPQIDIISHYRRYILIDFRCIDKFLNSCFYFFINANRRYADSCRQYPLFRTYSDNHSVIHHKFCIKSWMYVSFRHVDFNFLLFIYVRNSIPSSLRTILIICYRVSYQNFSISRNALNCKPNLVLNPKG